MQIISAISFSEVLRSFRIVNLKFYLFKGIVGVLNIFLKFFISKIYLRTHENKQTNKSAF